MKLEHRLSSLLQLHLHSRFNIRLQWIGQRRYEKHFSFGIWCDLYQRYNGITIGSVSAASRRRRTFGPDTLYVGVKKTPFTFNSLAIKLQNFSIYVSSIQQNQHYLRIIRNQIKLIYQFKKMVMLSLIFHSITCMFPTLFAEAYFDSRKTNPYLFLIPLGHFLS